MTRRHTSWRELRSDFSAQEIKKLFTLTAEEEAFVRQTAQGRWAQVGLALHLKTTQYLGYFTTLADIPEPIKVQVAGCLGHRQLPDDDAIERYDASGSRRRHMAALRKFRNVSPFEHAEHGEWLEAVAAEAAKTKHTADDIFNVLLEQLVVHRLEFPGKSVLQRLASRAQGELHDRLLAEVTQKLPAEARSLIDELLIRKPGAQYTSWIDLKQEPRKPTPTAVRSALKRIEQLRRLADLLPSLDLPEAKRRFFEDWARALDASQLSRLKPDTRYGLAAIFILAQRSQALDDAVDIFLKLMQQLENLAKRRLSEHQLEHSERADELVAQLKEILLAYQLQGTDQQRINAIDDTLIRDSELLVTECDEHLAYAGKNHLPFLRTPYANVRGMLFNCLAIADLHARYEDSDSLNLLKWLMTMRNWKREVITAQELGLSPHPDLDWITGHWKGQVITAAPDQFNRRYLELALLFRVRDEIKSGDLFVPQGDRFDDYHDHLVDDSTLASQLEEYGRTTGIEVEPTKLVRDLKEALQKKIEAVDDRFENNLHAQMVDKRLVLSRNKRPEVNPLVTRLDRIISERMAPVRIVDVLIDTTRWVDLVTEFYPVSGETSRLPDLLPRLVASLFCYGCNLGPVQTARSVRELSAKQVAWFNLQYTTEQMLDNANVKVINAYNRYQLPKCWGDGMSVSADGTQWAMYEQNLLSENHIRYGGHGGIGYYHVSNNYVALLSHFTTCGSYEAVHILDILGNQSDIQPDTIHGDTQAQSLPVFALAHLLGIKLMPRIRNMRNLVFSRANPSHRCTHLEPLFRDDVNWEKIEKYLPEMMRVAVSIKLGKITASTILRRLGTWSRKNEVYFAFRELGKVIRTVFMLEYIDDVDVRKSIQAATNKSEQFNRFIQWVFFGQQGLIAQNVRHEQRKIVKYSHLVANLVMLHNLDQMTRILAELQAAGEDLPQSVVGCFSPYRMEHINKFGDYTLDLTRVSEHPQGDRVITFS